MMELPSPPAARPADLASHSRRPLRACGSSCPYGVVPESLLGALHR